VDQKSQEKFDSFARDQLEMVLLFPPFGMVYDFQMDLTTRKLMPWQTTVPDFKYDPKVCLPLRIHNGVK
jgi:dynein heavy chain